MTGARVIAVVGSGRVAADDCRAASCIVSALESNGFSTISDRLGLPADKNAPADTREFVTASGHRQCNGVFWLERAEARPWESGRTVPPQYFHVIAVPGGAEPPPAAHVVLDAETLPLSTDEFGRASLAGSVAGLDLDFRTPTRAPAPARDQVRIVVVGHDQHLRNVNPSVVARLADAADAADQHLRLSILPPEMILREGLPTEVDGLLLPGGSDMGQVEAQVVAAHQAYERDVPTLGLCLGMQSMAIAAMRRGGWAAAALEEIAGPGAQRGFIAIRDSAGDPQHRGGNRTLTPIRGSNLFEAIGPSAVVRMNHRFRLAEDGMPSMEQGGLSVVAMGESRIADAVEASDLHFYIGLQGHPELGSDIALDELWMQFMVAASA